MPTPQVMTAYVLGWEIRARLNGSLVCYDLNTHTFTVFGDKLDILDLKIQCVELKDWLLDDRKVFEAMLRGDKEIREPQKVVRLFARPPSIRIPRRAHP